MKLSKPCSRLVILLAILLVLVSETHALKEKRHDVRQLDDDKKNVTEAPTEKPAKNTEKTTAPSASPTASPMKTDAPSAAPVETTNAPVVAPMKTNAPSAAPVETTNAPVVAPMKTNAPSAAPVETTNAPVVAPMKTNAPSAAPVETTNAPSAAPVETTNAPVTDAPAVATEQPVTSNDGADDDVCDAARCDSCREYDEDADVEENCFWDEDADACVKHSEEEHGPKEPITCDGDESKSPTTEPAKTEQTIGNPDIDDGEGVGFLIVGVVVLVGVAAFAKRFFFGMPDPYGNAQHGKYTGVTTSDDEEWGWGDSGGGGGGSTEMTSQPRGNLHYRSASPGSKLQGGSNMARKKKGLAVKKAGMNNPLQSRAAPMRPTSTLSQTKATTTSQQAPKPDDFFEQMGLAAKPTFSKKGLGATKMAADDFGDDDWGDNDLDDLLDD